MVSSIVLPNNFDSTQTFSSEEVLKYLPLRIGYEWIDKGVRKFWMSLSIFVQIFWIDSLTL